MNDETGQRRPTQGTRVRPDTAYTDVDTWERRELSSYPEYRTDADPWLKELRLRHWRLHFHPDSDRPEVIGAVFEWRAHACADVVILRGHDQAVAYRLPDDAPDLFAPFAVHWWYAQKASWTLRAVLILDPPPAHTDQLYEPPPFARIDPDNRRPVTIRHL